MLLLAEREEPPFAFNSVEKSSGLHLLLGAQPSP